MTRSRSRRIVLLLDCCYSGAFPRGFLARGDKRMDIKERFDGRGRAILTASSAMEYSFEGDQLSGEGMRSVFTSALVEGLETGMADLDLDGRVSVDELYDYVFDKVRDDTPNQTPSKWITDVQGKLFIARAKPRELPADLKRATESRSPDKRAAAVSELARLLEGGATVHTAAARQALERLADDDSRRVSTAAAGALAAAGQAAAEKAAAEQAAAEKAAAEQAAAEKAAAEQAVAEQAAAEQAEAEQAPPAGTRSRRPTWLPVAIVAVLALLGFGILGLREVLGGGGTDPSLDSVSSRPSTPVVTSPNNTPSTMRESATSAPPGPPVLTGPKNLTGEEQVLLDRIPEFFVGGGSCSRMTAPDDRDIRPEQAAANLECRYPGGTAIVYSMFQSDEEMNRFFDARLQRRNLASDEGSFGPVPGWQLNHCDDPDRGTGRIYGNRNTDPDVDVIRAEIGWVRDGFQMYAYAFRPKDDFADLFTWWQAAYGPVDSSPC
jgi:hypothetical protein